MCHIRHIWRRGVKFQFGVVRLTVSTEILIQGVQQGSTESATPPCFGLFLAKSCGVRISRDERGGLVPLNPFPKSKVDIELLAKAHVRFDFFKRVILQNLQKLQFQSNQNRKKSKFKSAKFPLFSGNENIECRVYHDALVDQEFLAVSTRSFSMSEPRANIARLENAKFGNDQVT